MNETERALGHLEADVDSLKKDMSQMKIDLRNILATLNQAKGGWKLIIAVGAIAGALGALLGKFIPFLR